MMHLRIIYLFAALTVILVRTETSYAQIRQNEVQTKSRLALSYYNERDYEKATPLLLETFHLAHNSYYFRLYLNAMIELKQYDTAISQIETEIKSQQVPNPEFLIHWGYVLKAQNKLKEAEGKFKQAVEQTLPNKGNIINTANTFTHWQEFEWVKKTYLHGRKVINDEQFYDELARANLNLRNYDEMLEEYLNLLNYDESQLGRVQSALAATLRIDVDNGLRKLFRTQILKRIQSEPNITAFNRLLIWFFLQEQQFSGALRQAIALDRRTGQEDMNIFQLGQMALNNKMYDDAEKAFSYLTEKGEESLYYIPAFIQNLHSSYLNFTTKDGNNLDEGKYLVDNFKQGLELLGFHSGTLNLIIDYAHLSAFYLEDTPQAIELLERGLQIPRLRPEETGLLKSELADIYVMAGDPWEATLLYSQAIDINKDNNLGDEIKLKKAKLAYYMGNFTWAKAQLDVLKASTSKLTANDAMDLSMLIGTNLNIDSVAMPLQMFARADLLFFRNKEAEAMATLDSIAVMYSFHPLLDNILFRKARIEINRSNYIEAAAHLQEITSTYSSGLLADEALFMLADLYNYQLNEKEKAKELYLQMLTRYPGSVFIEESREKFRELRLIYPDTLPNPQEELLIQDSIPNEEN